MARMKRTRHLSRSASSAKRARMYSGQTAVQTARRTAKNVIMRLAETKSHWQHANEVNLNTSTGHLAYDPLAAAEGTGAEERVGTEIQPTGLHIRGVLYNNGNKANYVRIVVVKSATRQHIGGGDFFMSAAGSGTDITAVTGLDKMYWPIHQKVHKVLYDRVIKLEQVAETGNTQTFQKWIKLSGKVRFDGAATGVEQVTPRYHIVYMASQAADDTVLGENVELSALHRFFYKDF